MKTLCLLGLLLAAPPPGPRVGDLTPAERAVLDRAEGVGVHYRRPGAPLPPIKRQVAYGRLSDFQSGDGWRRDAVWLSADWLDPYSSERYPFFTDARTRWFAYGKRATPHEVRRLAARRFVAHMGIVLRPGVAGVADEVHLVTAEQWP